MEENEEMQVSEETEELPLEESDDEFEESFDEGEDEDTEGSEDEDEFEDSEDLEDELFRENPLKALWIRLGEVRELLQND